MPSKLEYKPNAFTLTLNGMKYAVKTGAELFDDVVTDDAFNWGLDDFDIVVN